MVGLEYIFGDVLFGKYTGFIWFLVRFLEKEKKIANLGKSSGSYAAAKVPLAAMKVLTAAKDHHAAARPRGKVGSTLSSPQRSHCSQHGNVVFLFRFVFPLFRRLVYWTNKDPISV